MLFIQLSRKILPQLLDLVKQYLSHLKNFMELLDLKSITPTNKMI